jgi:hypothetical protein
MDRLTFQYLYVYIVLSSLFLATWYGHCTLIHNYSQLPHHAQSGSGHRLQTAVAYICTPKRQGLIGFVAVPNSHPFHMPVSNDARGPTEPPL